MKYCNELITGYNDPVFCDDTYYNVECQKFDWHRDTDIGREERAFWNRVKKAQKIGLEGVQLLQQRMDVEKQKAKMPKNPKLKAETITINSACKIVFTGDLPAAEIVKKLCQMELKEYNGDVSRETLALEKLISVL